MNKITYCKVSKKNEIINWSEIGKIDVCFVTGFDIESI